MLWNNFFGWIKNDSTVFSSSCDGWWRLTYTWPACRYLCCPAWQLNCHRRCSFDKIKNDVMSLGNLHYSLLDYSIVFSLVQFIVSEKREWRMPVRWKRFVTVFGVLSVCNTVIDKTAISNCGIRRISTRLIPPCRRPSPLIFIPSLDESTTQSWLLTRRPRRIASAEHLPSISTSASTVRVLDQVNEPD